MPTALFSHTPTAVQAYNSIVLVCSCLFVLVCCYQREFPKRISTDLFKNQDISSGYFFFGTSPLNCKRKDEIKRKSSYCHLDEIKTKHL